MVAEIQRSEHRTRDLRTLRSTPMTCTECGFTQSDHRDNHCPGGDPGDTFTRREDYR